MNLPYERIPALSYIRAVACFAIVVLHTLSASEILFRDQLTERQEMFSMMTVYLCMWAVPCFIMVTGVLQLNPAQELTRKMLFRTFIWRILKALFLCCILFRLFDLVMNGERFSVQILLDMLRKCFTGTSWSHLWYLYMLIGLYLFLPFFRLLVKHGGTSMLRYFSAVAIFFISVLPLTEWFGLKSAFIIPLTTIYPVYLFLGFMIHNDQLPVSRRTAARMAGGAVILTVLLTALKYHGSKDLPEVLLGSNASIVVVVVSCGIFALFRNTSFPPLVDRILYELDRCSFGIYLFHMVFLRLILRYWGWNPYAHGILAFPVLIVGVFLASYVLVWILKKIPVLRGIL